MYEIWVSLVIELKIKLNFVNAMQCDISRDKIADVLHYLIELNYRRPILNGHFLLTFCYK